jgi:hypothetical protein
MQRMAGNRAVGRLLARRRLLARYQIEGPFDTNDPVHEVLSLVAIRRAMDILGKTPTGLLGVDISKFPALSSTDGHNIDARSIDKSAQQFVRGVMWPDDPKGWLFDDDSGTENYSSGLKWYVEFDAKYKDQADKLIGRSHYGDLQFFHGMASADNEAAAATKGKVLDWARFLVDVATARISADAKLKDLPYTKDRFAAFPDYTVKQLFVYAKGGAMDARQRAAGALLHLIQDSSAKGHVDRNAAGEIVQFHSYEHQDHKEHGQYDSWGPGATLQDRINATPGAASAVEKCAQVLVMLQLEKPTDEIVKYLDEVVFKLASNAVVSGPGADFEKKPPPPRKAPPPYKLDPGKI